MIDHRLTLLAGFALALGLAPQAPAATAAATPHPQGVAPALRVAILPDRTGGPDSGLAILRQIIGELDHLDPDFVVNIGDMVQGYTWSPERWREEAAEYRSIVDALDMPWCPTAGNHDTFPGRKGSHDRTNEELYVETFGPLWYSYDVGETHFVHLYSDMALTSEPAFGDEQTAWLERDLAATKARAIFVFLHKPAWAYGEGEIWEPIHAILKRHPVKAVIAGHYHSYQKCPERDGIAYYIVGAAGGHVHKPREAGGFHHYCLLTIRGDEYSFALIEPGSVLADDFVLQSDYVRVDANGSYRNRDLWVAGDLPEPTATQGASGEVTLHLANRAESAQEIVVTVADLPYGGWRLVEPIAVTLEPGADREIQARLACDPWPGQVSQPPTLWVHFPIVDSHGRTVDSYRHLRVPLARQLQLAEPKAGSTATAPIVMDNWDVDYREEPNEARPSGRVSLGHDRLEILVSFIDANIASHPDQDATGEVLADALEVHLGEFEILALPFAPEGDARIWLERPGVDPVVFAQAQLDSGRDARGWWAWLSLDRAALDLAPTDAPREVTFNLGLHDNDFSAYTTTYRWVRPRSPEREARGILRITPRRN